MVCSKLNLLLQLKIKTKLYYKLNLNIRISRSTHDVMFDPNAKPYHQISMYNSIGTSTLRSTMFYLIPPITHLKCIYVGTIHSGDGHKTSPYLAIAGC